MGRKTYLLIAATPVLLGVSLGLIVAFFGADGAEACFAVAVHDAPSLLPAIVLHLLR